MIRIYFIGQEVPSYLVKCSQKRFVKFGSLFTIVYKKRNNFYVNGLLGRGVLKVNNGGCVGKFNLDFPPTTYIKKLI